MESYNSGSSLGMKNKYIQLIKRLHKSELISQNIHITKHFNKNVQDKTQVAEGNDDEQINQMIKDDSLRLQDICQLSFKTEIIKFYLTNYEFHYVEFHKTLLEYMEFKFNKLDRIYSLIYYVHLILQLHFKAMVDLEGKGNVAYNVLHHYLIKDLPKVIQYVLDPILVEDMTISTTSTTSDKKSKYETIAFKNNWESCVTNLPIVFEIFNVVCKIFNTIKNDTVEGKQNRSRRIVLKYDHDRLFQLNETELKIISEHQPLDEFFKIYHSMSMMDGSAENITSLCVLFPRYTPDFEENENTSSVHDVMLCEDQVALIDSWHTIEKTYHMQQFLIQYYTTLGFPSPTVTSISESADTFPTTTTAIESNNNNNNNNHDNLGSSNNNNNNNNNTESSTNTNNESLLHRLEFDRERHKKLKEQNWIVKRKVSLSEYQEFKTLWDSCSSPSLSSNDILEIKTLQTIYSQSI